MSNVNTNNGFLNLLPFSVTTSGQNQIVVPAFTYNSGFPVPSPTMVAGSPLYIAVPPDVAVGSVDWDGHPFRVRFSGVATVGATATFQPEIYLGNSATIGSNVQLTAPAVVSITGPGSAHFYVDALLLWDSSSLAVTGSYSSLIGATFTSAVAVTAAGSAIAMTGLVFTATVNFSVANAANTVTIKEFVIERA